MEKIKAGLNELNQLFAEQASASVIGEKETALKAVIAEENKSLMGVAYESLSLKELILAPTIEGYALKVERSEGVQTGYSIDSHKVIWLSISGWLSKHPSACLKKNIFLSYVRKCNLAFLARGTVDTITVSRDDKKRWDTAVSCRLSALSDSCYMQRLTKNLTEGKTVLSNTALSKVLQEVVDMIIFEDFGNGSNRYRVKNSHIKALLSDVLEFSKTKVGCLVAHQDKVFERNFLHVLNVIVNDVEFSIDGTKTKKMDEKRPLDWSDAKIFEEVKAE